jgi:hypothetical protein
MPDAGTWRLRDGWSHWACISLRADAVRGMQDFNLCRANSAQGCAGHKHKQCAVMPGHEAASFRRAQFVCLVLIVASDKHYVVLTRIRCILVYMARFELTVGGARSGNQTLWSTVISTVGHKLQISCCAPSAAQHTVCALAPCC